MRKELKSVRHCVPTIPENDKSTIEYVNTVHLIIKNELQLIFCSLTATQEKKKYISDITFSLIDKTLFRTRPFHL